MAVSVNEKVPEDEDASGLRKRLAEAHGEINRLSKENTGFKARQFLQDKGHTLVRLEDLEGVDPDKIEETADKLQKERADLQADLARDIFKRQGIDGDELEDAVTEFLSAKGASQQEDPEAEAYGRARSLGKIDSKPVPAVNINDLHGTDAIEHGLVQAEKRLSRR